MSANLLGRPDPRPLAAATGNHYHIILRGNRRQALFSTPADRRALNGFAIDALLRFDATLHAYCLMPNTFRFLVQMHEKKLIKAIRRIVSRYSRHMKRHSNRTEPPFEPPYEARCMNSGDEFLECLRSIHLGPVIGNLVVTPEEYRWSSHRAYLGYKSVAWVRTEFGLSLLSPDITRARSAYPGFISAGRTVEVEQAPSDSPTRAVIDRLMGLEASSETAPARKPTVRPLFSLKSPEEFLAGQSVRRRRFLSIY